MPSRFSLVTLVALGIRAATATIDNADEAASILVSTGPHGSCQERSLSPPASPEQARAQVYTGDYVLTK